MTDNIIFASVLTRKGIVEDVKGYSRIEAEESGYYRSDDVEMRIEQEEEDLVSTGWHQRYVDGVGTIYIDRWVWHRKGTA